MDVIAPLHDVDGEDGLHMREASLPLRLGPEKHLGGDMGPDDLRRGGLSASAGEGDHAHGGGERR